MSNNKKIVFITRHDPSGVGGGAYATKAYLNALIHLYGCRIVLFVSDNFDSVNFKIVESQVIRVKSRNRLSAFFGLFFGKLTRFNSIFDSWIRKNSNNIEKVIFDGGIIGGTFVKAVNSVKGIETLIIHHNEEIEYHLDNKSIESFRGKFLFWINRLQRTGYKNSDKNLFITQSDLQKFEYLYGKYKNYFIGCFESLDNSFTYPICEPDYNGKIVISGALNAKETVDGIYRFNNNIFKLLKINYPNISLTIVGKNPSTNLAKYCKLNGFVLIDSPADIKLVIQKCDLYVCPTYSGGGMKIRLMDPFSLGIPSLVHENSIRGYEVMLKSGFVNIYNDANDFFIKYEQIINSNFDRKNSSIFFYENFSFEVGVLRLGNILNIEK